MAEPPLRADARRNRQRILDAARAAFAEAGRAVPLDEIAARAGVGPGTVYRHFPTKEALFQAVVAERVGDLVAEAQRLAGANDPGAAFFAFLSRLGAEAPPSGTRPTRSRFPARSARLCMTPWRCCCERRRPRALSGPASRVPI